jgi:hypothetical protein
MAGLFGGKSQSAAPPVTEPVPLMPLPDDQTVKKAKRKSLASQAARRGRASTIFTNEQDMLGG